MKKLNCAVFALLTLCGSLSNADTWTSIRGDTFEGEFIGYNSQTEIISIKRDSDGQIFGVAGDQLSHTDRVRAIRLQDKNIADYWYTDYEKIKVENPDKRCLILYRNNSKTEDFELFCLKLLLRKDFTRLLKSRGIIVCIPETIPDEVGMVPYKISSEKEWKTKRVEDSMPRKPVAFFLDFAAEKRINDTIFRAQIRLHQPPTDPNPFLEPTEPPKFIAFDEIEQYIRRLKRP